MKVELCRRKQIIEYASPLVKTLFLLSTKPITYLLKSVENENLDFFGLGVDCFKCSELGLKNE